MVATLDQIQLAYPLRLSDPSCPDNDTSYLHVVQEMDLTCTSSVHSYTAAAHQVPTDVL